MHVGVGRLADSALKVHLTAPREPMASGAEAGSHPLLDGGWDSEGPGPTEAGQAPHAGTPFP